MEYNIKEVEKLLGKKPTQKELSEYLGVSPGAVSQYPENKKELMILGLWVKRKMKND